MDESVAADEMTANLVGSSSDKQALVAAPRWPLAYAALCLANMAEAVEVLTAGYILERATDDEFVQTSIAAAVFIGMMFGGLFSGPAADAYGRAALLKWALALSTVASFAAAASPEAVVLVLCRFVAGAGVGAATPPLFALAVELAPPGRSGPGVVAVQSFWMVGQITASAMALACFPDDHLAPSWEWGASWRRFALVAALLPTLSTTAAFVLLREPPRDAAARPAGAAEEPSGGGSAGGC